MSSSSLQLFFASKGKEGQEEDADKSLGEVSMKKVEEDDRTCAIKLVSDSNESESMICCKRRSVAKSSLCLLGSFIKNHRRESTPKVSVTSDDTLAMQSDNITFLNPIRYADRIDKDLTKE